MIVRLLRDDEQSLHDDRALHPLQSWDWGQFRIANGQRVIRVGRFEGESLVETQQISLHRIPASPWYIGYCPRGPLPSAEFLDALKTIARKEAVLAIKFEPDVWRAIDDTGLLVDPSLEDPALLMSQRGLVAGKSQFTAYSFILDLDRSEEELLSSFASKTRYNIRLSARKGVRIEEATTEEGLETFIKLIQETSDRQGFYAHSAAYYRTMFSILSKTGRIHILHAVYNGEVLTAWILFRWKDRLYYPYGSSSSKHRELMANNLIMWESIRLGKRYGLSHFDLWGCMGPNPDEKDPWYGFHRFKKGYNPTHCKFVGTWDLVLRPLAWKLFTRADTIRWKILRLRKRERER